MEDVPQLGKLLDSSEKHRDAIHIAIAPVTAATNLSVGQHVGFVEVGNSDLVGHCDKPIGIVDPFLRGWLKTGERFWLFLYPQSITSLRHIWRHPAFDEAAALAAKKAEKELVQVLRTI